MLTQILQGIPFFSSVPADALSAVAADSFQKRYRAGERVVVQGEYGHTMFVIVRGGLRVLIAGSDGEEREVARLDRPGQFFGELSVISQARRTATVVADSEAILLEIEKQRIEKLSKDHKQVLAALEQLYEKRVIAAYVFQCGHFVGLPPDVLSEVTDRASLRILARDDAAYEAGQPNDALFLVKEGHLKMHRPGEGAQLNVLGYFNAGDFFGVPDEGGQRQATVTALGRCEVIRIPIELSTKLLASPVIAERLRKVTFKRKEAMLKVLGGGRTVAFAAQQLMLDGQVEAASLLIIDLETCVRCGNCSASCHDRWGASRLARRGKKLRRRERGFDEGKHQHVLVPSSCYHCSNPECMVGCPTGAIHREKDGEVNIYDFCIGCTNCARRCPYDNITMADREDAGELDAAGKKKSQQIATKCNLCAGHDDAACVANCPTGAILRVDPKQYFEEIAALRGDSGKADKETGAHAQVRHTIDQSGYRRSPMPVLVGALVAAAMLLGAWLFGSKPRGAASATGVALGIAGAAACFGATLLAVRRRIRKLGKYGTFQRWTQIHIALGAVGFFAALLHANFSLHGWLTATLLMIFGGVFLSGFAGQLIYTLVPPLLARIEGDKSMLVEDVWAERKQLEIELAALCDSREMHAVARAARSASGGFFARTGRTYRPDAHGEATADDPRVVRAIAELPPERRPDARRAAIDVSRIADHRAQLLCYRVLRVWLALHISATALLLSLLVAHILVVLVWFR
jgi:Fe-S-cluster-containing dehydrogenase component